LGASIIENERKRRIETKLMPGIPTLRCKNCGREFTPDTDDVDFIEWIVSGEGVECPYCGSYCPIDEIEKIDPDEKG
jgi:DNA-directed RNA polymerase subunit RPC12/RpoP